MPLLEKKFSKSKLLSKTSPQSMLREVLQPEFRRYAKMLEELVEEIIKDITDQIHKTYEWEMVIEGQLDFSVEVSQDSSTVTSFQDQPSPHPCAVEARPCSHKDLPC